MAINRWTMPLMTIAVWALPVGTRVRESADGRTEYWIAADAQSPRVRYSKLSVAT
ncbi:unannotated protein [freshwater metagenome]|uniref:Unannotated protein n=1 Tax=freshwater metagenome TaxID=449393 RepID=A0A6J7IVD4_9ZZZZ